MKYESNTPMYSKDIVRKPFFVRTGQDVRDVRMYVRTDKGDAICPPPPIINGGGIKNHENFKDSNELLCIVFFKNSQYCCIYTKEPSHKSFMPMT